METKADMITEPDAMESVAARPGLVMETSPGPGVKVESLDPHGGPG